MLTSNVDIYNLKYLLRKHPVLLKLILKKLEIEPTKLNESMLCCELYLKYHNILKNDNFHIILDLKDKTFEDITVIINNIIKKNAIKKYSHYITSEKYLKLYNNETYSIFEELYNLGIGQSHLQTIIGKKMASFNTSEDFNLCLSNLFDNYSNFKMESIINKADEYKIDRFIYEKNIVILKIDNFPQMQALGASGWCIVRNKRYFQSYTENHNQQYVLYDFNKCSRDYDSIVGITLKKDKTLQVAYFKNDEIWSANDVNLISIIDEIQKLF